MGIHSEILEKVALLVTVIFGFLAAFAWNNVISNVFIDFFSSYSPLSAMAWYAGIMTILALLGAIGMGYLSRKARRREL
jgi:hypothetical protein